MAAGTYSIGGRGLDNISQELAGAIQGYLDGSLTFRQLMDWRGEHINELAGLASLHSRGGPGEALWMELEHGIALIGDRQLTKGQFQSMLREALKEHVRTAA